MNVADTAGDFPAPPSPSSPQQEQPGGKQAVKQCIQDPLFGARVSWSPGHMGYVTVENDLRIWNPQKKSYDPIRNCRLKIHKFFLQTAVAVGQRIREEIREESIEEGEKDNVGQGDFPGGLFMGVLAEPKEEGQELWNLAIHCAITIWEAYLQGRSTTKQTLPLWVTSHGALRIILPPKALSPPCILSRFFKGAIHAAPRDIEIFKGDFNRLLYARWTWNCLPSGPIPWEHLLHLSTAIYTRLLPFGPLFVVLHPPRGRATRAFPVTSLIPGALFACYALVQWAFARAEEGNKELSREIARGLRGNEDTRTYIRKYPRATRAFAVGLVHRKFCGKEGYPGLLQHPPDEVFHSYLYKEGQKGIFDRTFQPSLANPRTHLSFIRSWCGTYL